MEFRHYKNYRNENIYYFRRYDMFYEIGAIFKDRRWVAYCELDNGRILDTRTHPKIKQALNRACNFAMEEIPEYLDINDVLMFKDFIAQEKL